MERPLILIQGGRGHTMVHSVNTDERRSMKAAIPKESSKRSGNRIFSFKSKVAPRS